MRSFLLLHHEHGGPELFKLLLPEVEADVGRPHDQRKILGGLAVALRAAEDV